MTASDPLKIAGSVVADKYLVDKAVGHGGFSVVYRAAHTLWKRPVAIKFFSELSSVPVEQRDEMQRAFIDEGALLTELSSLSPSIVQARDVGALTTPEGRWLPYIVLEWLEGRTLEALLADEAAAGHPRWSLAEMMRVLSPVAAALDVAHRRGIAHRDVKPPNIIVNGDVRGEVSVKLLDFGVAKLITDSTQRSAALARTGTKVTSFTPQYGAPEQFSRANGATGPWTDVFALALVATEMLAGRPALGGDDVVQFELSSRDTGRRPTPRQLGVLVPDEIEAVFARAVAAKPEDGFAAAGEFWTALSVAVAPLLRRQDLETLPPPAESSPEAPRADTTTPSALVRAKQAQATRTSRLIGAAGALALVIASTVGARHAFRRAQAAQSPPPGVPASPSSSAKTAPEQALCPAGMFEIPAGQFYMGSDEKGAADNQKPSHNVSLHAFCVDEFEVTVDHYVRCHTSGACRRLRPEVSYQGMSTAEEQAF